MQMGHSIHASCLSLKCSLFDNAAQFTLYSILYPFFLYFSILFAYSLPSSCLFASFAAAASPLSSVCILSVLHLIFIRFYFHFFLSFSKRSPQEKRAEYGVHVFCVERNRKTPASGRKEEN